MASAPRRRCALLHRANDRRHAGGLGERVDEPIAFRPERALRRPAAGGREGGDRVAHVRSEPRDRRLAGLDTLGEERPDGVDSFAGADGHVEHWRAVEAAVAEEATQIGFARQPLRRA